MTTKKLQVGQVLEDFTFDTPYKSNQSLYELSKEKTIVLAFLRYYGCTICQVDIHNFIENYKKFEQKNAEVFVVLQSDPKLIAEQVKEGDMPLTIVCDPQQALYKTFEITPAKSKLGLVSAKTLKKMNQSKKMGFVHGAYEGEELQLPALFIADKDKKVTFAHYGKSAGDLPEVEEILGKI